MGKIESMFDEDRPLEEEEDGEFYPQEESEGFKLPQFNPILIFAVVASLVFLLAGAWFIFSVWINHIDSIAATANGNEEKISTLANQTNQNFIRMETGFRNIQDNLAALDMKLNGISTRQAACDADIGQMKANISSLSTTLAIEKEKINNLTAQLIFLNGSYNLSAPTINPVPLGLRHYENLSCYQQLRLDGWGPLLDVEALCNMAQAGLEDYVSWQKKACDCAREAGINV